MFLCLYDHYHMYINWVNDLHQFFSAVEGANPDSLKVVVEPIMIFEVPLHFLRSSPSEIGASFL